MNEDIPILYDDDDAIYLISKISKVDNNMDKLYNYI